MSKEALLTDEELAEILAAHQRMQAAPWPNVSDLECGRAGKVWTDCAIRYMGRLYNEVVRLRAENANLRERVERWEPKPCSSKTVSFGPFTSE